MPREPAERKLLAAGFVDALGTGLLLPLTVIYLTRIVGLSVAQVGLGLAAAGCVGVVVTPVSGALLDRFDARVIVCASFAVSAIGFLAYVAVDSFAAFVAVATVVQVASRIERPAMAELVLEIRSRSDGVTALAWQQTLRNLGYGLGGLLAALALLFDSRATFEIVLACDALSYLVAGALVASLPESPRPLTAVSAIGGGFAEVMRDRASVNLISLNVLVSLHDSMLRVAVPLWIVERTNAPPALSGLLFALNTLLVVKRQLAVSRAVSARRGIDRSYLIAAVAFGISGSAFALAAGPSRFAAIALLAVALAALTVAELENSAGEAFLSIELAPKPLRGRYISLFKTSIAMQQAVGPALRDARACSPPDAAAGSYWHSSPRRLRSPSRKLTTRTLSRGQATRRRPSTSTVRDPP